MVLIDGDAFENTKVLIVGGAGFVGSNLAHALVNDGGIDDLWIVDNLLSSELVNVPQHTSVRFLMGSIADDQILSQLPGDLDYVFHLACFHGNQSSIHDPIKDHDNNTITSLKLFEHLSRSTSLRKVVYAAAGCAVAEKTYGEPAATSEDAPVSLFHDSPYSISKLVGEMYGNYYFTQYGMPFVKARFQNVYGPREILGAGNWRGTRHTVWRNVTPTLIWKSLHGEPLPLDNQGESSRDFIYVDDIVRGLLACAVNGEPGEAYNLASGRETSILELANIINGLTENSQPHSLGPARPWDRSGRRFGSPDKSRDQLGFEARVPIGEGLARTVEWTKENHHLIRQTMARHEFFMEFLGRD